MKQRTLRNRTLAERSLYRGWEGKNPCEHIRAELDRLARQVRKELKNIHANTVAYKKSKEPMDYILYERGLAAEGTLKDVLDLIREAKR